MRLIRDYSLYVAWVIALAGTLLSLYYGEVMGMEPCRLCWYQRIAMFPLALWLGIAAYQESGRLALYCLPLALFGAVAALYQSAIQLFPFLKVSALCGEGAGCTLAGNLPYASSLGFIGMALLIFLNFTKKVF